MSSGSLQTLRASSLRLNVGMQVIRPARHLRRNKIKDHAIQEADKPRKPRKPRKLDGFLMLEVCRVELPAEALQACLADKVLVSVVAEDMKYFVHLEWIDAGENQLQLEMFSMLPNLHELRLHCNRISHVPQLDGLQTLQRLDLSYNTLDAESIQNLSSLGALRELDLSGNQLRHLPDMGAFTLLEKLFVEYNCLAFEDALHTLAYLPSLQHLSFAHNRLRGVQAPVSPTRRVFPALETLDLTYNKIKSSGSLSAVISFQRLKAVLVYGNPLCGPTGEDPTRYCVEELIIAAIEMHKAPKDTLQFVTEIPRKKQRRWNREPGRQAFYQNIDMKHVASFEETLVQATEEVESEPFSKYMEALNLGVPDAKPTGTFMTGMDLPLERPSDTMFNLRRTIETTIQRATNKAGGNTSAESNSPKLGHFEDADAVPERLLHPGFDQSIDYGDARPKAIQQAMKELRYILNHPLESPGSLPYYGSHLVPFLQPTALTIIRQRPLKHYSATDDDDDDDDNHNNSNNDDDGQCDYATSGLHNAKQAIAAHTRPLRSRRPDFRKLRQIEQALDSFNKATSQAAQRVAADILSGGRQTTEAPSPGLSLQEKMQGNENVLA